MKIVQVKSLHTRRFHSSGYALWCAECKQLWALVLSEDTIDTQQAGGTISVDFIKCPTHGQGWIIPYYIWREEDFDPVEVFAPEDLIYDLEHRLRLMP